MCILKHQFTVVNWPAKVEVGVLPYELSDGRVACGTRISLFKREVF